jgi:hypothetical protein
VQLYLKAQPVSIFLLKPGLNNSVRHSSEHSLFFIILGLADGSEPKPKEEVGADIPSVFP